MGWLIALGVLTLIAIIPIGVSAFYDEIGPRASIIIGPLRVSVFPLKKKEEKEKKKKVKTIPRSYTIEKFYPTVNGYAFDDFQTAWWYCQEVVGRSNVKQCTLEGLENKFKSLLVCLQNNTDYLTGKRKYTYCGNLELTLVLKED